MGEAAFTPGPWTVRESEAVGIDPGDGRHLRVAYVDNGFALIPDGSYRTLGGEAYTALGNSIRAANARLIAAAPDLLDALKGAIGALEFSRDYHKDLGNEEQAFAQDRLDAALTAIAKASN